MYWKNIVENEIYEKENSNRRISTEWNYGCCSYCHNDCWPVS